MRGGRQRITPGGSRSDRRSVARGMGFRAKARPETVVSSAAPMNAHVLLIENILPAVIIRRGVVRLFRAHRLHPALK